MSGDRHDGTDRTEPRDRTDPHHPQDQHEETAPDASPLAPVTPADAFDMLHEQHAPALLRQTFLLCGSPALARRAVAHAFRLAWRRWPQVAVDPEPGEWVRAVAHRHALAPWHDFRLLRSVRRGRAMRHVPPGDRPLLEAFLMLPRPYRAALLLHDGLGLRLGDTAAELEAGSAATSGRLRHAREALAVRVPALHDVPARELPRQTALLVGQLAAPQPVAPSSALRLRGGSEARARCATAASLGLVAGLAAAAVVLVVSGQERSLPPLPVPERPSATLAPDRQPGRLRPTTAAAPLTLRPLTAVRHVTPVRPAGVAASGGTAAPAQADGPAHAHGPAQVDGPARADRPVQADGPAHADGPAPCLC